MSILLRCVPFSLYVNAVMHNMQCVLLLLAYTLQPIEQRIQINRLMYVNEKQERDINCNMSLFLHK